MTTNGDTGTVVDPTDLADPEKLMTYIDDLGDLSTRLEQLAHLARVVQLDAYGRLGESGNEDRVSSMLDLETTLSESLAVDLRSLTTAIDRRVRACLGGPAPRAAEDRS